jgi:hypothetical protein
MAAQELTAPGHTSRLSSTEDLLGRRDECDLPRVQQLEQQTRSQHQNTQNTRFCALIHHLAKMSDLGRNKVLASLSDSDRVAIEVAVRELGKAATEVSGAAPSVREHQQPLSELIPAHSSDEISALLQLGYTETQVCRRQQRAYAQREREREEKRDCE